MYYIKVFDERIDLDEVVRYSFYISYSDSNNTKVAYCVINLYFKTLKDYKQIRFDTLDEMTLFLRYLDKCFKVTNLDFTPTKDTATLSVYREGGIRETINL